MADDEPEKAGTKSAAIELYRKRKQQALEKKKLPEKLRAAVVTFQQLAEAALEYSQTNKASYKTDTYRMPPLIEEFGARQAENILPEEFEAWLDEQAEVRPVVCG